MAIVSAGRLLCRLTELADPGSKGVRLEPEGLALLVVRRGGDVWAYRNACPHTGAPMEWLPDQFLNYDQTLIQCALHGAQFLIENGYCIYGPCSGQSLGAVAVEVQDGDVLLAADVSADRHFMRHCPPSSG